MSDFKMYVPKTEHEALKEYYRANESASHKKFRRALAHLIVREVHQEELRLQSLAI